MNCDSLFHRSLFLYCDWREKCLLCPMWLFPPAIPSVATGKIILQTFVFVLWSIEITVFVPHFFSSNTMRGHWRKWLSWRSGITVSSSYNTYSRSTELQKSRMTTQKLNSWRTTLSEESRREVGKKKKALQRRSCEVSYKKTMLEINCCSDSASFFKIWCRWVDCADYIWVNSLPYIDN